MHLVTDLVVRPTLFIYLVSKVDGQVYKAGIDTRFMYAGPATNFRGVKYELPYFQVPPLINLPDPENHRTYIPILGHGHTPKHGTHYDPGVHWDWFRYKCDLRSRWRLQTLDQQ